MPRGGKRANAGRRKGSTAPHTAHTRERKQARAATKLANAITKELFCKRVEQHADRLFNAQLAQAEGCTFLFRQDIDRKTGKRGKPEVVTNPEEIKSFLDAHGADGSGASDDGAAWYFMTTERP